MSYIEKKIDSEEKYRGVIVNVRLDHAELCDGSIVKREVVEHPGGVEADIFTYGGRTLILAHAAEPLCGRFSAQMRVKRKSRTR